MLVEEQRHHILCTYLEQRNSNMFICICKKNLESLFRNLKF